MVNYCLISLALTTDSDENTVASLGYGKSVRIPAETVGGPERVLQ